MLQCHIGHTRGKKIAGIKSATSHSDVSRSASTSSTFFLARARCLSAGLRYLRLTHLPRHDRGPVPGGIDPRLAASCLCTVPRRALYHYATRSPPPVHPVQLSGQCVVEVVVCEKLFQLHASHTRLQRRVFPFSIPTGWECPC